MIKNIHSINLEFLDNYGAFVHQRRLFFAELMSVLTKKIKIYDVLYWCFELFVEK